MALHLERELNVLRGLVLGLGGRVEESLQLAVSALLEKNHESVSLAKEADVEIDELEVKIEEECLKILALHQPVAVDLRYIVAILKINNDLERIGDLSVNIAKKGGYLAKNAVINFDHTHFAEMAEKTQQMLRDSLDSVVHMNVDLAQKVCDDDAIVDKLHKKNLRWLEDELCNESKDTGNFIRLISISRNFERIGDLATNIAEDTIYLVDGRIVRHGLHGDD